MPSVDLPVGPVEFRDFGPVSSRTRVAVFVHGFLVNGTLWEPVAERLAAEGIRCVVPDWPLGAHRRPADPAKDLTPDALAGSILGLLEVLDLEDAILVGNDTGGGLCQLALRGDTRRVAGLVLTNCDAFEHFPPAWFVPLFVACRSRAAVWLLAQQTRLRAVRNSPLGFGPLLNHPISPELTRQWVQPMLDDPAIRRDVTRFARAIRRTELADSAEWLRRFPGLVHLVWGTRDKHFTIDLARRLESAFPNARLEAVADATTFVPIDRPDRVAAAILEQAAAQPGS